MVLGSFENFQSFEMLCTVVLWNPWFWLVSCGCVFI